MTLLYFKVKVKQMPILSKTAKMRWNPRNKKYFVEKGYTYTKMYDYFDAKIEDLDPSCNVRVKIQCDVCGKIDEQSFCNCFNQMTVCHNSKCVFEKKKNTMKNNYSVINVFQLESTKQSIKDTCKKRYGKENYAQTDEFKVKHENTCLEKYNARHHMCKGTAPREKALQTNLERYGTESAFGCLKIQEKAKQTNLKKYGFENPSSSPIVRKKVKQTLKDKYNANNVQQIEGVKSKTKRTLKNNESGIASSKDQNALHHLLGGKLNFKVTNNKKRFYLDIAFPDEKFYIEVDSPGHFVYLKIRGFNEKQFYQIDKERDDFIHQLGYKNIRLISRKKNLINLFKTNFDEFFVSLIDKLKSLLQDSERVLCDFDNKTIMLEPSCICIDLNSFMNAI